MTERTVVFVHSYCLKKNGWNLSPMAQTAIATGIELWREGKGENLIVSCAYDTAKKEQELYQWIMELIKLPETQVHYLLGIQNSYDEAERAIIKAIALEATRLIVVAEKYHARRSEKAFREVLDVQAPGLELEMKEFTCDRFEELLEPSMIKRWRSRYRWSWRLWNILLERLPTSFLQRMSGKMDE